jgi:hypothetical protein
MNFPRTAAEHKVRDAHFQTGQRQGLRAKHGTGHALKLWIYSLCALVICLAVYASPSLAADVHVPGQCVSIQNEINNLKAERTGLQNELKSAAPGEKPNLAGQILQLNKQITPKEKQLDACAKTNGGMPDVNASFKGNATMTTNNSNLPGPFVQGVSISAYYPHWLHDRLDITSFPKITVGPFSTPVGSNTTTVTQISNGGGPLVKSTGEVQITVTLHFDHSLIVAGDSDMTITLSTENPGGSRLAANGAVTLVGTSKFDGGYLGGNTCKLIIKGTLTPNP